MNAIQITVDFNGKPVDHAYVTQLTTDAVARRSSGLRWSRALAGEELEQGAVELIRVGDVQSVRATLDEHQPAPGDGFL
jgi:hypothetical protein